MKKPAHQWETRLHVAFCTGDAPGEAFAGDARAQVFELRFRDGRRANVTLGLQRQHVDAVALADPDLVHAIDCWLMARGARTRAVYDERGRRISAGAIDIDAIGSSPGSEPPARIITLAPSNAEFVAALGAFDRVIACEDSSDWPPACLTLERLGPDLGPDLDRVVALQPELVVSSLTVPGMERIVTGLHARGVRQVVLAPRSLDDVLHDGKRLGRHLFAQAQADALVSTFSAEREQLRAQRRTQAVRVYLEWWPRPMFTPGRDCYSNELIALAGGVNVFADRSGSSIEVDAADLIAADPEVCFVSWCGVDEAKLDPNNLCSRPGLEALACVRAKRVYALDERYSGRPGPRMLEAARRMAAAIRASDP